MEPIIIDKAGFRLADLAAVARKGRPIRLSPASWERIAAARELVDEWVDSDRIIYGITTGFGALSDVPISKKDARRLQENILMSHSAGVGDPFDPETVRGVMALRVKDLARGNSGIRPETVSLLAEMLNRGVCPVIPRKGSVGASGDLAPMAHMGLVLIGKGEAFYKGERLTGGEALRRAGLSPVTLQSAEGLALVNGTQVMTAVGGLAAWDARHLSRLSDIAAAMSLEVLMGSRTEFDPRIQQVRPHPGQAVAADNMFRITENSDIITSHKDCCRVQDAYTLRCSPQVHGASRDAIDYACGVLEREMNSSTGNPLIFPEDRTFLLGGNFHGQPVAMALDFMAMAAAEMANITERRVERLVNPMLSGLPAFLVEDGGLNSGFMIAQYTAAALVSENKVLAHPACVDSIPTSANKEDHVSMGTIAARKCREIVDNTESVIAIELLCAAQALDLFTNLRPGEGTIAAYKAIRETVSHMDVDRVLATDIEAVRGLMRKGIILEAVETAVGPIR
jgi:histidine ammonia-lyase